MPCLLPSSKCSRLQLPSAARCSDLLHDSFSGESLPGNRINALLLIRWAALLYLRLIQSILALIQSGDGCNGAVQYPPCCICGQLGLDCTSSFCPARMVSEIGHQIWHSGIVTACIPASRRMTWSGESAITSTSDPSQVQGEVIHVLALPPTMAKRHLHLREGVHLLHKIPGKPSR